MHVFLVSILLESSLETNRFQTRTGTTFSIRSRKKKLENCDPTRIRTCKRKPGARVTNSALAFTYIWIMQCYIAQWHSGIKSRPIFWIWTLDGFRCFAHARVSSS